MYSQEIRRRRRGSAIAEFGPSIWIFFMIIVIPLIDMGSFMWGVGAVMMTAQLGVRKAVGARTYTDAIAMVNQTEDDMAGFRVYSSVVPSNGAPRGVKLNVIGYDTAGGATGAVATYNPPPGSTNIPVDRNTLDKTLYHYQLVASYDVLPLFNFANMPVFSGLPGLGTPVPITFQATANVEHPEGLNQ